MKIPNTMIDTTDAVMCLIDHQSGLFQLVRDMEQETLRRHAACLSRISYLAKIPTFSTASVPDGPNGPLIPEIHDLNPDCVYIPRTGQINAWHNPAWVEAIEKTGRKTLIIAGTLTSVCMAFPALSALAEGYKVFCVIDASGNWSSMATDITIARLTQAGAFPIDTNAVLAELVATWNRPDVAEFAEAMTEYLMPAYKSITENYNKAQQIQRDGKETKLDKQ